MNSFSPELSPDLYEKATGSEIDQGTMMRYLNEMTWFPAAFLGENISWKAVDELFASS